MRATYPDHFVILELITLTGKEYELYTLSFYGFLPPLIGPKFILSTVASNTPKLETHPPCVLLFMVRMAVSSYLEITYAGEPSFSLEVRK